MGVTGRASRILGVRTLEFTPLTMEQFIPGAVYDPGSNFGALRNSGGSSNEVLFSSRWDIRKVSIIGRRASFHRRVLREDGRQVSPSKVAPEKHATAEVK